MKAVVTEMYEPLLIGNTTLEVDLSAYRKKVQALKSDPSYPLDELKSFHIIGQIGHLLVKDLLVRYGWKILSHDLGRGTSPLVLDDPVRFLENNTGKPLSEEVRKFLSSPSIGIPGLGLRSDLLVAKKDTFAMVEIKSSEKDIKLFKLTLPQYIYYNKAHKLGIPIKLILVNLDRLRISISTYFGELANGGLFKVTLYKSGLKWLILKLVSSNPGVNLTKIFSMIYGTPREIVVDHSRGISMRIPDFIEHHLKLELEGHLVELESAGLVAKEKDRWYCTHKGSILMKSYKSSQKSLNHDQKD